MRNPERIKPTLKAIEDVWAKYPDLRLGQLLENALYDTKHLWVIEDDLIVEAVKAFDRRHEDDPMPTPDHITQKLKPPSR